MPQENEFASTPQTETTIWTESDYSPGPKQSG